MKFKGIAIPSPSKGVSFEGIEELVVPDQSMTLQEILKRFTRGEALPIGQPVSYGDENPLDLDLEKLAMADLTEKADASAALADIKNRYEKQEKGRQDADRKKAAEAAKAAEEKRVRIAARKLAAKGPKHS